MRFRDVARLIFLTIILVLMANIMAWYYLKMYPSNRAVSRVWQKWQMVERINGPHDWVLLGDSSCGQGLRPDILSAELGGSAINLCTVANATVVNEAWMLQRYIEKYGPPRAVILFHVFHIWERRSDDLIGMFDQIPLPNGFWNRMQPHLSIGFFREAALYFGPTTTLYFYNLSIRHILSAQLKSFLKDESPKKPSAEEALEDLMAYNGYTEEKQARPEKVKRDVQAHINAYKNRPFEVARENLEALHAISSLSKQYGFQLFLSNSSIAQELYAELEIQRFFREMNARLVTEIADNPNAFLVLQEPPLYRPEQMDNVDHVVGLAGAESLTRQLAGAIRAVYPPQK